MAEALRQPGRAARADAAQDALAVLGEAQPDAAAVVAGGGLRAGAGVLEPVDVPRHRGRRHALAPGELAEADPRLVLDRGEERDLAGGDAGLGLSLPPELAGDSQEHRTEPVGERERIQSPCPHQLLTRLTKLSSAREART